MEAGGNSGKVNSHGLFARCDQCGLDYVGAHSCGTETVYLTMNCPSAEQERMRLLEAVSDVAREYRAHDSCETNEYAEELDAALAALDKAEKGKEEA